MDRMYFDLVDETDRYEFNELIQELDEMGYNYSIDELNGTEVIVEINC